MKKIIALILSVLMVCALAACGGDTKSENAPAGTTPAATESKNPGTAASGTAVQDEQGRFVVDNTAKELVIVDDEKFRFVVDEIRSIEGGFAIMYTAENKSDSDCILSSGTSISEGTINDAVFIFETIPGNSKISNNADCTNYDIKNLGLEEFTQYEVEITATDDSFNTVADFSIIIYPQGKDKAEIFTREAQPTDQVVFDKEGIKITLVKYEADSLDMLYGYYFIENTNDYTVLVTADEFKYNSEDAESGSIFTTLGANTVSMEAVYITSEDMEAAGIKTASDVKTVSMDISLTNSDNFSEIADEELEFTVK